MRIVKSVLMLLVTAGFLAIGVESSFSVTYTVVSREDSGSGTLRDAITQANASPDLDTIVFSLSNSITVYSVLMINSPVIIDGGKTQVVGSRGSAIFNFFINSSNSILKNIAVVDGDVGVANAAKLKIVGCTIGTDWINSTNKGNNIGICGGAEIELGGTSSLERNIISGNNQYGIEIDAGTIVVRGNYIGVKSDGATALGNGTGIYNQGGVAIIGGNGDAGEGNVISGNIDRGIEFRAPGSVNGNIIGLNSTHTLPVPNGEGILIKSLVRVGESTTGCENIIAGNNGAGIKVSSLGAAIIRNNYIGLTKMGIEIPNYTGIVCEPGGDKTIIGGLEEKQGNYFIGANIGLNINGSNANTIVGNTFGVLPDGRLSTAVFSDAIKIEGMSASNFVGIQDKGNLIANATNGINITGNSKYNSIVGNTICSFSGFGIALAGDGSNDNKVPPQITYAHVTIVAGTADIGDSVELFLSERKLNTRGGSLKSLGVTTANSGKWSIIPSGLLGGELVCAIATDVQNNSSAFSINKYIENTFITSLSPAYSTPGAILKVAIRGSGFSSPAYLRLTRDGYSDIVASSVLVKSATEMTGDLDLMNAIPGKYNLTVDVPSTRNSLAYSFLILERLILPVQWTINDIGHADIPATQQEWRGIEVADWGRNGYCEVYAAGLINKIILHTYGASGWSAVSMPQAGIGQDYTDVIVCDANCDGENEIFGSRIDGKIFRFLGSSWYLDDLNGEGSFTKAIFSITYGDGDNDGNDEIYAACQDGHIYALKCDYKQTGNWSKTDVGQSETEGPMNKVVIGDGNNDSAFEVYSSCQDGRVYQFKYNGLSWERTLVGFGGGSMLGLAVGDCVGDGFDVYGSNQDGNIYRFIWTSPSFFRKEIVGGCDSRNINISDADNNGSYEIYCASTDGHIYQFAKWSNSWTRQDLGTAPVPLYNAGFGDGDHDNRLELYAIGENSHVY